MKPEPNYGIVEIGYRKFLLELSKAITVVEAFADAEQIEGYGEKKKLVPMEGEVTLTIITAQKYKEIKTIQLLEPDTDD